MRRTHCLALLLLVPAVSWGSDTATAVEGYLSSKENMFDGNTLYELRPYPHFFEGYVSGVADTGALTGPALRRYCIPGGVKVQQMADVTYRYLVANPADRHLGAAHLVRQSFREAWPCPPEVKATQRRPAL